MDIHYIKDIKESIIPEVICGSNRFLILTNNNYTRKISEVSCKKCKKIIENWKGNV